MNRPIKFRAWDVDRKIMHTDILGRSFGIVLSTMKLEDYEFSEMLSGKFNQFKVMQFTGLLDKNGKEIYESDRIDYEGVAFRVEWREASFVLVSELSGEWIYLRPEQPLVVTGNLYESN